MSGSNVQADNNGGGGLNNLFALAHLANLLAMAEEERGATRSPPTSSSPSTATVTTDASTPSSNSMSYSRRPAKKRAVPANFDTTIAPCIGGVIATTTSPAATKTPKTATTSKPSAKRPKKSKSNQQRKGSISFKMKANQPSFPVILLAIMSAPQNKEFITFLSDGRKFIIIRPEAVARNVLPIHFEDNVPTYDQFLHLLAIWGFDVVKDPQYPQVNVYKHPMFQKGDWEACLQMKLPDPTDQQVMSQAHLIRNKVAEKSQVADNSRNDRIPELPALPVPNEMAEAIPLSPRTTVHSVTPPVNENKNNIAMRPSSDAFQAALLERAATQTIHQQYSNLGPKFSSMKENLMYRSLLQESMGGQGIQDRSASLRQTKLQLSTSLASTMMGYSHPSMKTGTTLPMNHRRASLDAGTGSYMSSSSVMGNHNAMLRRMERMPMPFASGFHHGHPQPQQEQHMQGQMLNTATTPSDAEVRSATEDIVSAAIDALRPESRRHAISRVCNGGSTSHLDAMTDVFLERSMARLSSRPVAIMGPRKIANAAQQQQVVHGMHQPFLGMEDANNVISRQSLAWLAARSEQQQRKVSILSDPLLAFGR
mmetsp:Transcript_17419/g.37608  ORF Transcript_17419/g.37608 Transcript_17419/m.37608 type:complete len:595 (-) Transcript_17419:108-1892(-)